MAGRETHGPEGVPLNRTLTKPTDEVDTKPMPDGFRTQRSSPTYPTRSTNCYGAQNGHGLDGISPVDSMAVEVNPPRSVNIENWRMPNGRGGGPVGGGGGTGPEMAQGPHRHPSAAPTGPAQPAPANSVFVPSHLLDSSYAYCISRGDGFYTQLVPADMIHSTKNTTVLQRGAAGMLVLPELHGMRVSRESPSFQGPLSPTGVQTPELGQQQQSQNALPTGFKPPEDVPIANVHNHPHNPKPHHYQKKLSDTVQNRIDSIVKSAGTGSQRKPKIYCDKWVHEGVCAFTQQGCKYKHEMPHDSATQHSLGLFHGYPAWWKKHQAELQRQKDIGESVAAAVAVGKPCIGFPRDQAWRNVVAKNANNGEAISPPSKQNRQMVKLSIKQDFTKSLNPGPQTTNPNGAAFLFPSPEIHPGSTAPKTATTTITTTTANPGVVYHARRAVGDLEGLVMDQDDMAIAAANKSMGRATANAKKGSTITNGAEGAKMTSASGHKTPTPVCLWGPIGPPQRENGTRPSSVKCHSMELPNNFALLNSYKGEAIKKENNANGNKTPEALA